MGNKISIYTADDFLQINSNPSARYELKNDIDFSGVQFTNFVIAETFDGELIGNGYTIRGIQLRTEADQQKAAVFKKLGPNSMVHRLTIQGLQIDMRATQAPPRAAVYACGLAFESEAKIINNCHINGMFVQYNNERGTFNRIVGITKSAQRGNGAQGGITRCSVRSMEAECEQWVHVFGIALESRVPISDCYIADVRRSETVSGPEVLLYSQQSGIIKNCYIAAANGYINPDADPARVINCYFDNTVGKAGDNPFGRSTNEMQQQGTYENWDFEQVWNPVDGTDYPRLRGENIYNEKDTSLMAKEYDSLLLTSIRYSSKGLTSYEYDRFGKILLP